MSICDAQSELHRHMNSAGRMMKPRVPSAHRYWFYSIDAERLDD